jgi:uncharacterized lipoprotein YbaY/heat shock protein HslJ/uncharacterized lipoprotein NlpE involved in copper resistance
MEFTGLRLGVAVLGTSVAAALVAAPALAGTLSGTATIRERIALPPDAEFEVLLVDIARADAPATVLGRQRLAPAGQPPFRFTIAYDDDAVTARGRYSLRATVRHQGQLLFTTDRITPVLTGSPGPIELVMVPVGGGRPDRGRPADTSLGTLPASWRGDIPDAFGGTRWHVDLAPDLTYQLRQTQLGRPAPNRFDDIGRWRLEPGTSRLVLRGGREAPLFLQAIEAGNALRKLDLEGRPITSQENDRLERLPEPAPIDPSLNLQGLVSDLPDAATIRLCATGQRLPVAMEGDYRNLERAYNRAQQGQPSGRPLLAGLQGLITTRPSAEPGQPPRRTLVVERFVNIWPGQGCPPSPMAGATEGRTLVAPLRGTSWRLLDLRGATPPSQLSPQPRRPVELVFAEQDNRVSGSGGCNLLSGSVQLDGELVRFGPLASTRMACPPALMAFERRYVEALGRVRRWSIDKRSLLLQDARGRTLLLFQALP